MAQCWVFADWAVRIKQKPSFSLENLDATWLLNDVSAAKYLQEKENSQVVTFIPSYRDLRCTKVVLHFKYSQQVVLHTVTSYGGDV